MHEFQIECSIPEIVFKLYGGMEFTSISRQSNTLWFVESHLFTPLLYLVGHGFYTR